MAVTYKEILRQAALRIGEAGSIAGTDANEIAANYSAANFGEGEIDSPAFPYVAQVEAMLLAEERIAQAVSSIKDHPLRQFIRGITSPLANRAVLPKVDTAGDTIIGVIGSVYDATDKTDLSDETTVAEIERLRRLSSVLKKGNYFYQIRGSLIIHTRTNVILDVCKYNKTKQAAAVASGAAMLFPDALEETLICGEISYLFRPDEMPDGVKYYAAYFNDTIRRLEGGAMPQ